MKKHVLAVLLAALALVEIAVLWSAHLQERAEGFAGDPARRIRILERAARLYPWNAAVRFELGRAYFETAQSDLDDPARRDSFLSKSAQSLRKSLGLDPGSAAGHFHLAQSLLYMTYLGMETPAAAFEEYKRAALLTGHNTQIYFEVGKILLARWDYLPAAEKTVFEEVLRRLLEGRDQAKLRALLEVWFLHSQDTALIESVMPEDPGLLRTYASFLGERSLSIAKRREALARAENLDFEKAQSEFEIGQRSYDYYRTELARGHLGDCLSLLKGIRFYGDAAGRSFDDEAHARILRDAHLLLAKIEIDKSRNLDDPNFHLSAYLTLEDRVSGVAEFETFLRERGLLGEKGAAAGRTDLTSLPLELTLDFLQNRYRDITKLGAALESRLLVVTDAVRADYVEILRLVGESSFKLDFIYEAERYFRKALALEPGNIEVLLGLERCHERRNDQAGVAEVRKTISALLSPAELALGSSPLAKGETGTIEIVSDGLAVDCTLELVAVNPGIRPLVTVEFEGKVVFEDYVESGRAAFSLTPRAGTNAIRVRPVNGPIKLVRLHSAPLGPGG